MAAFGGFAGTTVTHMMRVGISRAINSNEAGQGSSPLIHSSAHTIHPVRQGLWGATEVFVDTAITCSVSALAALAVLVTGLWSSGLDGATLTVAVFETFYVYGGVVFIGVMMFLFGLTTTAGWFSYYNNIFEHLLRNHPKIRDTCISVFKFVFPIPNVFLVTIITLTGGARINWAIADICLVIPVFINLVVLVLLNKDFFKLLKDYKARYMGIGTVDPNFKPFLDTPPTKEEMEELEEIAG